ncbi:MAG TPA: hypothetical protein VI485_23310 [Vicinamibacterales bacterium]|nr:hypothetical protein [Vicinamibacterales bacterium]
MNRAIYLVFGAVILGAVFLACYLPDLGHGFIRDDFRWIRSSRSADLRQLVTLFSTNVGFYRPLVSVSFAADYAVWGLNPLGYGVTNLMFCVADAVLLFLLARRLTLPASAAAIAAGVWAFNFHGINMALLWLSGRTALLAALFALATAHAVLRGWRLAAGLLCLAAMLCKEEAVLLPALFVVFTGLDRWRAGPSPVWRHVVGETWALWVALAIYAALRMHSGAFGPADAPSYYQFSFSPGLVWRNLGEYADRIATASVGVVIVLVAACGWKGHGFSDAERRTLLLAGIWIPAMCALTMFLPLRSSLYAVLPSIGASLAAGAFASRAARADGVRFQRVAIALVVIVALTTPIYRSRNQRWVQPADLSTRLMQSIADATRGEGRTGRIVLIDSPGERLNLEAAFGGLFADAVALMLGDGWMGEIAPSDAPPPSSQALVFRLRNGELVPIPPD